MSAKKTNRKRTRVLLIILILAGLCALCFAGAFVLDMETLNYYDTLTVEAGDPWPAAEDFLKSDEQREKESAEFSTNIRKLETSEPGSYPVKLRCFGKVVDVTILVQDTVAPVGTVQDLLLVNPETVSAEDLLVDYSDATQVHARFEKEPVLTESGSREVVVLLEDAGGNVARLPAQLTVLLDTQAPVIEGAKNLETYVEDTIAYRNGITVSDDQDGSPELTIDNSAVDLSTPGVYDLIYTATDHAGNTSSQTVTVKVYPKKENHVEPEVIYEAADKLLAKFIRDDMTTREKAEAVYCWVQMHTQYASHSEKDDWLQAAYSFLMNRRGDCYSYFALNKLLLQRLGIPTIDVEKVKNHEGDTRHYWLLVSIDDGESYYHFDNVWSMALCLVTDQHLDEFSAKHDKCFNRDTSLYPATPEEKLPASTLPWNDPVIRGATR